MSLNVYEIALIAVALGCDAFAGVWGLGAGSADPGRFSAYHFILDYFSF